MARRTNYGFEKKQRELKKLNKKREKAERRIAEAAAAGSGPEPAADGEEGPADR